MDNKTINIVFSGLGGQGVLTISDICSQVAMAEGFSVKRTDLHGLSQRGGVVESHLRIGENIYSPLIMSKDADYNISLDQKLSKKFARKYLKKDGQDLTPYLSIALRLNVPAKEMNFFILGILSQKMNFKLNTWNTVISNKMAHRKRDMAAFFLKGVGFENNAA